MPHRYLTSYERATEGLAGPSVVEIAEPEAPQAEQRPIEPASGRRSRPRAPKPAAA